jgi:hypothetical protein
VAILVQGGRGLDAKDRDGLSDPYVICRIGALGSAFDAKPRSSEHRSSAVQDTLDPEWKLAFKYAFPSGETTDNLELHIRVLDLDLFSTDDVLGELRLPLNALLSRRNEVVGYKLAGSTGRGEVFVMAGDEVESVLFESIVGNLGGIYKTSSWADGQTSLVGQALVTRLGQFFVDPARGAAFYTNLAQMALAWNRPLGMDASSKLFRFLARSGGGSPDEWAGPFGSRSRMLFAHAEVVSRLTALGGELGTNDGDGALVREPHSLGQAPVNDFFWRESPHNRLGLSWATEAHGRVRPLLVDIFGPGGQWSRESLRASVGMFMQGRRTLDINSDMFRWSTIVLHKIALGIDITVKEATDFSAMQSVMLVAVHAPEEALPAFRLAARESLDKAYLQRQAWLKRAQPQLRRHVPGAAELTDAEIRELASVVCDALVFAGGFAVPTVLSQCLSIPFTKWGVENLPKDLSLDDPNQHALYVWECIRLFAPVSIFATLQERRQGGKYIQ